MLDLETYLSDGIYSDRGDIATIEQVLVTTGETIAENFDDKTKDWPYEIRRQDGNDFRDFSQSTTAMMIRAIDLLREAVPGSTGELYPFKLGELSKTLGEQREAAFKALVANITPPKADGSEGAASPKTHSGTYGTNDPLTLSFLSEILPSPDSRTEQVRTYAKGQAKHLLDLDPAKEISKFFEFPSQEANGKRTQTSMPLTNAFIPLCVVRACQRLLDGSDFRGRKHLLSILREHASRSALVFGNTRQPLRSS